MSCLINRMLSQDNGGPVGLLWDLSLENNAEAKAKTSASQTEACLAPVTTF